MSKEEKIEETVELGTEDQDAPDATEGKEETGDVNEKKFSQADLDMLLKQRLDREKKAAKKAMLEEKARLAKEAREAELLKDGKLQELADERAKEAEAARAELAAYKRREKVDQLLDKHEVLDPAIRDLLHGVEGDLEEVAEKVQGFKGVFQAAVEKAVNARLGTDPPPRSKGETKPKAPLELAKELEAKAISSGKPEDWAAYAAAAGAVQDGSKQ